jgi:hypothetical protein
MLTALLVLVVGLALYLLPTLVAKRREKRNLAAIAAVNILLGWTFVGWVIALVWALSRQAIDTPNATPNHAGAVQLCAHCGKYSPSNTRFCGTCGVALG